MDAVPTQLGMSLGSLVLASSSAFTTEFFLKRKASPWVIDAAGFCSLMMCPLLAVAGSIGLPFEPRSPILTAAATVTGFVGIVSMFHKRHDADAAGFGAIWNMVLAFILASLASNPELYDRLAMPLLVAACSFAYVACPMLFEHDAQDEPYQLPMRVKVLPVVAAFCGLGIGTLPSRYLPSAIILNGALWVLANGNWGRTRYAPAVDPTYVPRGMFARITAGLAIVGMMFVFSPQ